MPKEIRKPDTAKERTEWVRAKAGEYRKEMAELDHLLDDLIKSKGPSK